MTITAKFPSICPACNCRIQVGEQVEWQRGAKATHATVNQCAAAKAKKSAAATTPVNTELLDGLKPVVDFLKAAQERGLKSPKLRILHMDAKREVRLSITRLGAAPGSIAVVIAGDFYGAIRPTGEVTFHLSADKMLQEHLLRVAKNPAAAAKEYAAVMGLCSFCSKPLTDEGSVEVGYGPVCAKHWGLPHKALGTPVLAAVPGAQMPLVR